jgi:hypothetical protein
MPEGLTQTKTPTSKTPAGFKSECRPVSFRNGGRLQIGTMAGFKSEYPAEINRNPHSNRVRRCLFCEASGFLKTSRPMTLIVRLLEAIAIAIALGEARSTQ